MLFGILLIEFGQATYFSAVCVAVKDTVRLQIQLRAAASNSGTGIEREAQLIIEGEEKDISAIPANSNTASTLEGVSSHVLFLRTDAKITVYFSTGMSIGVTVANVRIIGLVILTT